MFDIVEDFVTSSGEDGAIVEKRQRSPLCPDFNCKERFKKSGHNSDWNNDPFAQRPYRVLKLILLQDKGCPKHGTAPIFFLQLCYGII
ncbi:hypothetical protein [Paenibacillus durus]|uniref:hypothetical protein n=1 Tax=Paenibacillus durus TaxID=44251 RepID=UPI00047274B2|nr:hypothetical protein [Paenibacillus durus]